MERVDPILYRASIFLQDYRTNTGQTKKLPAKIPKSLEFCGTPGRIRTCGLRIRSPALYPAELRALMFKWGE